MSTKPKALYVLRRYHCPMESKTKATPCNGWNKEILHVVKDIDRKLGHLICQLRDDLYVLVPREKDELLGGPLRRRRRR